MTERVRIKVPMESSPIESEEDSLSEGMDPEATAPGIPEESGMAETAELLQSKDQEIKALSDRLLRLQAEFENFRKRTAKERGEVIKFANEGLLGEIIPVVDSLERAIQSANENVDIENLLEGLRLVRRLLNLLLERAGVKEIHAQGEMFNPELHEAISVVESGDHPDNTIVEEVQKGYLLNGRVLRPSIVRVSKSVVPDKLEDEGEES
jgi:molecular chaperone GrpE